MGDGKDNGGPAFPAQPKYTTPQGHFIEHAQSGMTLRDWFAGQAPEPTKEWLETMYRFDSALNPHNDSYKPKRRTTAELIAAWRYEVADAMIETRAQSVTAKEKE